MILTAGMLNSLDFGQSVAIVHNTELGRDRSEQEQWKSIMSFKGSAPQSQLEYSLVGLGMPMRVGEMQLPRMDAPQAGRVVRAVTTDYALEVGYSDRLKNSPVGKTVIPMLAGMVAASFTELRTLQAIQFLFRGFLTAANGGIPMPDGVPFFSNVHPSVRGNKTSGNAPTGTLALSYTALSMARAIGRKRYNDTGMREGHTAWNILTVGPDLESLGNDLVKSQIKPLPYGGTVQSVEPNFHQGLQLNVIDYLDSGPYGSTPWFLSGAPKDGHGIGCFEHEAPNSVTEYDPRKRATIVQTRFSHYFLASKWTNVFGSTGQ